MSEKKVKNQKSDVNSKRIIMDVHCEDPAIYYSFFIGNIKISSSRSGRKDCCHIITGRADSLEGGDFKVSELEEAIQDFFDKNF